MATPTQQLTKELRETADAAVSNAKQTAESVRDGLTDAAGNVKDAAQSVFMAGLGALVTAKDAGVDTFESLVKRGEKVDLGGLGTERVKTIRENIDGAADKATDAVKGRVSDAKYVANETAQSVEDRVQDAVAAVMKRLGVPTREEITELTASVERLTARVEEAKKERAASAEATIVTPEAVPAPAAVGELTVEAAGGGWYEIHAAGEVIEKAKGRKALAARLAEMTGNGAVSTEAVGGGWYAVRVGDVTVEKVQGEEEAEATAAKLA